MVDFVLAGRRPGSQEKQESENTREISEVAACKTYSYTVGWLKLKFHVEGQEKVIESFWV